MLRIILKISLILCLSLIALNINNLYTDAEYKTPNEFYKWSQFLNKESAKAYMGVYLSDLDISEYKERNLDKKYGILIDKVIKDTPADKAGLKKNDIILEFDKQKIYTSDQISKILYSYEPGDMVIMKIFRNDDFDKVKITLGDRNEYKTKKEKKAYLGVFLNNLNIDDYEERGMENKYGVEIDKIVEDGPCQKAGLEDRDVILEIDGNKVYTSGQITKMLNSYEPDDIVKLKIFRDGSHKDYEVKLGERATIFPWSNFKDYNFFDIPKNIYIYEYDDKNKKYLGIVPEIISKDLIEKYKIEGGILIKEIIKGSPAEISGLEEEDIIIEINNKPIISKKDLRSHIQNKEIGEEVELQVIRKGDIYTIKSNVGIITDKDNKENMVISLDNGKVFMFVEGDKRQIIDLNELMENIYIKDLDKLDSLKNKLEDIDIDIEIGGNECL